MYGGYTYKFYMPHAHTHAYMDAPTHQHLEPMKYAKYLVMCLSMCADSHGTWIGQCSGLVDSVPDDSFPGSENKFIELTNSFVFILSQKGTKGENAKKKFALLAGKK